MSSDAWCLLKHSWQNLSQKGGNVENEEAWCLIESHTTPDKYYKIRLFLSCECKGFENRGHCRHIVEAMKPDVKWTPAERS